MGEGEKMKSEYVKIKIPTHPFADKGGFVFEHRLVVETHIKRYLKKEEVVHHLSEVKDDNRIQNLMIFSNQKEHQKFHLALKQFGWTEPLKRRVRERWDEYLVAPEINKTIIGV